MKSSARTIPASRFRNECLKLLDEVQATGDTLVVTKHGRPVAAVVPFVEPKAESVIGWAPDMVIDTDLTQPAIAPEHWHAVGDPARVIALDSREGES